MQFRAFVVASVVVVGPLLAGHAGMASAQQIQAAAVAAPGSSTQIKTVYHFTNGLEEASRGLGNIRNHLAADPSAKITVTWVDNKGETRTDEATIA